MKYIHCHDFVRFTLIRDNANLQALVAIFNEPNRPQVLINVPEFYFNIMHNNRFFFSLI